MRSLYSRLRHRTILDTQQDASITEETLYLEWKRYGTHLLEYGSEFLGTFVLLVCVVDIVGVMLGSSSPVAQHLGPVHLRLFITGLLLGGTSWLIALSAPGRLSGAHLNPAVSVGFWIIGKMHGRDTAGYVVAQLLGAAAGVPVGAIILQRLAHEVDNGTLHPGSGVTSIEALAGEIVSTFLLTFLIYSFLSHRHLERWTPAVAMLAVGVLVWADGTISGAGMNPARWFGPALSVRFWQLAAVYVFGPVLGAASAAASRRYGRILPHSMPRTGKIYHDPRFRSIFPHDGAASSPPKAVREKHTRMQDSVLQDAP